MATTLQFCRAMAVGLTGEFRSTGMCRRLCAELDSELDRQLGGTFADGFCWSTRLQEGGLATAAAAAGEDLAQTEAAAVADGRNRACALLGALGRLYERSHLLLLAGPRPARHAAATAFVDDVVVVVVAGGWRLARHANLLAQALEARRGGREAWRASGREAQPRGGLHAWRAASGASGRRCGRKA